MIRSNCARDTEILFLPPSQRAPLGPLSQVLRQPRGLNNSPAFHQIGTKPFPLKVVGRVVDQNIIQDDGHQCGRNQQIPS